MVKRQGLSAALDAEDTSRVSSVGLLEMSVELKFEPPQWNTNDVDLVVSDETNASRAARDLFFVLGVCQPHVSVHMSKAVLHLLMVSYH